MSKSRNLVPKNMKAPDYTAAVVRSIVGASPFAGSALAEVITAYIPNQRLDRVEAYVLELGQRLNALDPYT